MQAAAAGMMEASQRITERRDAMNEKGSPIEAGMRFSRLLVLGQIENSQRGERRWLCRCDCGKEKSILERSLLYGETQSCGCLRVERYREQRAHDLSGQVFGDLTVLNRSEHQRKNGGVWWTCRCSCGKIYECPATLLVKGRRTHCGCKTNRGRPADIAGEKFNRLTAIYPLTERDDRGSVMWHCRCECGNEVNVFLQYAHVQQQSELRLPEERTRPNAAGLSDACGRNVFGYDPEQECADE